MEWEVLAMWGIVGATMIWFIRDEKRLRADAALERAARYYAHAPQYRHVSPEPTELPVPPAYRIGGLSDEQRTALRNLASR